MKNVVIAGYVRSPFHIASKGALVKVRPDDLAAQVVKGLIEQTIGPIEIFERIGKMHRTTRIEYIFDDAGQPPTIKIVERTSKRTDCCLICVVGIHYSVFIRCNLRPDGKLINTMVLTNYEPVLKFKMAHRQNHNRRPSRRAKSSVA